MHRWGGRAAWLWPSLFPGAKEVKQTFSIAQREAVFAECSYSGDGPPHLLEVGAAAFAHGQMSLEARALSRGKHIFQIRGHGLDQLLACQIVGKHMPISPLIQTRFQNVPDH